MSYVSAPFYTKGPGTIVFFRGGDRTLENVPFQHHMRLGSTFLAINGCLMAQWTQGDTVSCCVRTADYGDAMETSSE